jgi:putative FmdB family regulatory protein
MPIFEYACQDCGTKFEKLIRRDGEEATLVCPKCGEAHLRKELSTFSAHANGAPKAAPAAPPCASGMCPHPGMCGRN